MTRFGTARATPKQDRAVATRAAILDAAALTFIQYGYSEATLAKITKNSTFSNGALYHHFPSREAVALAIIEEYEQRAEKMVAAATESTDDALYSLFVISKSFAEALVSDRIVLAGVILTTEVGSSVAARRPYQEWVDHLTPLIQNGQQQGRVRDELDPADVAALFVSAFTGMQLLSAATSDRDDLVDRLYKGWRVLFVGIASSEDLQSTTGLLDEAFGRA